MDRTESAFRRATFVLGLVLAMLMIPVRQDAANAEPVVVRADYAVSLVGLPVARLKFVTEVDGRDYRVSGEAQSTMLSDIVARIRGTASVSGKMSREAFLASRFTVAYTSGAKAQRIEIELDKGDVTSTVHEPRKKPRGRDWVPLAVSDLSAVLDPLSGMMIPAGARVCPRSLPIFDGESRIALHLSPKGVRPFSTAGFKGDAIVCSVRFEPKAGYRKGSSSIVYLSELKDMEIWYAEHEQGGFYAPVYARIPTEVGQVIVYATRFGG